MANMVTCGICGKSFDFDTGGTYDRSGKRFVCPDCAGIARTSKKREAPEFSGKMIAKLIIGGIFLAFGVSEIPTNMGDFAFGLAIGLPLILWALFPWIRYYSASKNEAELKDRLYEEKIQHKKEQEAKPKICPGCGATSHGQVCEYCGTRLP